MDADAKDEGYKLPPDFQENTKEALVDFTVTDSTELWLIDLPKDQTRVRYPGPLVLCNGELNSFQGRRKGDYLVEITRGIVIGKLRGILCD
ncbi:hypothetical protein L3X38_005655 [Prunus dulcis]|uniref:Uncharacterized protein n=1 Tax=Prunus dulcis TaxID=3755 RepID=A0AAD4ZR63_PRUDU|nr:hypothetical protein L3X38_005655 [Prunus dulcis]